MVRYWLYVDSLHGNPCRTIGDKLGEAKACGNIGNTLKVLGIYDEALSYCNEHLLLSVELHDKVSFDEV